MTVEIFANRLEEQSAADLGDWIERLRESIFDSQRDFRWQRQVIIGGGWDLETGASPARGNVAREGIGERNRKRTGRLSWLFCFSV